MRSHLVGIDGLPKRSIVAILDRAESFFGAPEGEARKLTSLKGRVVINLFYESSTRTRTSFEIAGKRLSAEVINIAAQASSVSKGESLIDTAQNLRAMGAEVLVMRHPASGSSELLTRRTTGMSIVNAGDGQHEHPSQALLDAFTIRKKLGTLEGLRVAICGDVLHSRVARSNLHLLRAFGSEVRMVGPRTLVPREMEALGARVFHDFAQGIEGADIVMMLRLQHERMKGALLPSLREYAATFGLMERHAASLPEKTLILHPGPINRGVEIDHLVADGQRSVILDQVEAGVAVRMAILDLLVSSPEELRATTP